MTALWFMYQTLLSFPKIFCHSRENGNPDLREWPGTNHDGFMVYLSNSVKGKKNGKRIDENSENPAQHPSI
jgi:hypothetical protein